MVMQLEENGMVGRPTIGMKFQGIKALVALPVGAGPTNRSDSGVSRLGSPS